MTPRRPFRIVHLSAARYHPGDKSHSTYAIWQNLQIGFERYHILARTSGQPAHVKDGHLELHLIPSFLGREVEVLLTQFFFVPIALRIKPDAIVSQNPVLGGVAGVILSRLCRIPHLVEVHSEELSRPQIKGLRGYLVRRISGWVYRRADRVRVLTSRMRSDVMASFTAVTPAKIHVLPPRANRSAFESKANWSAGEKLRVIMVGSVVGNKGQLRAIRTLASSHLPIRLWIVGDGPDMESCRVEAEKVGSKLEVTFFGRLAQQEVAGHLLKADIFLMNSLSEGTPRAIMEAMALGLPVVTTDAGYCGDIVEHNRTGFVVPCIGGEADLIRCLKALSQDTDLRRRMGQAGMERAKQDFDSEVNFARYRALILDMIEEHRGKRALTGITIRQRRRG